VVSRGAGVFARDLPALGLFVTGFFGAAGTGFVSLGTGFASLVTGPAWSIGPGTGAMPGPVGTSVDSRLACVRTCAMAFKWSSHEREKMCVPSPRATK
jgi:hypothetical protein